ncbi:vacuolar amino acid transporter 4 [Marasmius fiardii PR-910]|nr:vacuolar amino acid transporter 4 [Marasmius fiardii PR-910]
MSSPSSKPVAIKPKTLRPESINDDNALRSASGSLDTRHLRAQFPGTPPNAALNIPLPRTGTPMSSSPAISSTPVPIGSADAQLLRGRASANRSSNASPMVQPVDLEDLPDEEKARILRRHLVLKEERERDLREVEDEEQQAQQLSVAAPSGSRSNSGSGTPRVVPREVSEAFPIPYDAPGADVTHDIYRWHANAQRQAARVRSASFHGLEPPSDPAFEHIHEPGGFRRNYVLLRANEQGAEEPVMLNNFIDFLYLYGHFAGEDLEEDDEEEKDDEEQPVPGSSRGGVPPGAGFGDVSESAPLMGGSKRRSLSRSKSRRRAGSVGPHGNATVTQAVLMLLKGFVGTGILFLGKAFMNGGILFSSAVFIFIAVISLHSFLLLVKSKLVVPGSYGDIGGVLYGNWMRQLILASIVIAQIGFVSAYTIFVAENLQAFVLGVTNCVKNVPVRAFILMQTIFFLPLSLIRDIVKLSTTALVADAFIVAGLIYIFGSEFKLIAERGTRDVILFNPAKASLFIGTAVFSFEGICLIVPITDSMREPHKFPKVLTGVMAFLLVLFGGAGVLAYLTFGSDIKTVVLVNLNPASKMVQAVQVLYSMAIMLSVPLQLFPAIKILENAVFTRSGKVSMRVKWYKNSFRFLIVFVASALAFVGAKDLDKFIAFVGSFAGVPLCYVYPAMLHYRACAHTKKQKIADLAMITFGMVVAVFTTVQTIKLIATPDEGGGGIGACDVPVGQNPSGLGIW